MKKPYISPWISSTYPSTEDEDYSEVVIARLEGGVVIPAKWDITNKVWLFQEIKLINVNWDDYVIYGFDTLHYGDTRDMWPKDKVFFEAERFEQNLIDLIDGNLQSS